MRNQSLKGKDWQSRFSIKMKMLRWRNRKRIK